MPDRLSLAERSELMARIRAKNTGPEMTVRRLLHRMGFRYTLHDRQLPGTPDIVFPARKKVIQVHGCFWHGHRCGRCFIPATNTDFWVAKISRNRVRDQATRRQLRRLGWDVLEVFECQIRRADLSERLIRYLER